MGEVSFSRLGARLPLAAVNSAILEAYVIPGYEKPTDREEAILNFLKGRDVFVFPPNRGGRVSLLRHSSHHLAAFLQLGKTRSTHVLVTTFSFCKSKPDHTLGKGENLGATLYSPAKKGFATLQEHTAQRGTSTLPVQISHLAVPTSVT